MNKSSSKVNFHFLIPPFNFNNRTVIKNFILSLFEKEGQEVEQLNYIFCDDDYLLQINKQYLNHNTLTDIITFPLSEENQPIISDIYISIPRVKENASTFKTSFKKELQRVLFHGALHLCGYKDKTKAEEEKMREKENFYINLYSVSRETNK